MKVLLKFKVIYTKINVAGCNLQNSNIELVVGKLHA